MDKQQFESMKADFGDDGILFDVVVAEHPKPRNMRWSEYRDAIATLTFEQLEPGATLSMKMRIEQHKRRMVKMWRDANVARIPALAKSWQQTMALEANTLADMMQGDAELEFLLRELVRINLGDSK